MKKFLLSFFLLIVITLFTQGSCKTTYEETAAIDAARIVGVVPAIHGVNNGPLVKKSWNPPRPIWYSADYTERFKETEIPQSRTHGEGPMDMEKIWIPYPDYSRLDPNDDKNYNWEITDERVVANYSNGSPTEVYIRFGHSPDVIGSSRYNSPPEDFQVFADVCKQIVAHYNNGWDNGYNFNIKYIEVWNEPYLEEFWNGSATEYAQMYEAVYNTLKAYDPTLQVGPSMIAGDGSGTSFGDIFFQYTEDRGVGMDFIAPHYYRAWPWKIKKEIEDWETYRGGLYSETPLIISEWNRTIPAYANDTAGQSFLMSMLSIFTKSHIDNSPFDVKMTHYFAARDFMWEQNGDYKEPGYTWDKWHDYVFAPTPYLVSSSGDHYGTKNSGNDFTVLGTRSLDGGKVHVLLSAYDRVDPDNAGIGLPFDLTVKIENLPWGNQPFTWTRLVYDTALNLRVADTGVSEGIDSSWTYSAPGDSGMKWQTYEIYTLEDLM